MIAVWLYFHNKINRPGNCMKSFVIIIQTLLLHRILISCTNGNATSRRSLIGWNAPKAYIYCRRSCSGRKSSPIPHLPGWWFSESKKVSLVSFFRPVIIECGQMWFIVVSRVHATIICAFINSWQLHGGGMDFIIYSNYDRVLLALCVCDEYQDDWFLFYCILCLLLVVSDIAFPLYLINHNFGHKISTLIIKKIPHSMSCV